MTDQTPTGNNIWEETPEEKEFRKQRGTSGGSFTKFEDKKVKQGENVVRLVSKYEFIPSHWFNKVKRSAVCPGLKDCPVCNHPDRKILEVKAREAEKTYGKGTPQSKAVWRKFFTYDPDEKYAINVIDREDGKLKVWKFGKGVRDEIATFKNRYNLAECDIVIVRTGEGLKTRYKVYPLPPTESRPLTEEELAQAAKPVNLKGVYKPTSVETIQAYLRGEIPAKKQRTTDGPSSQAVASAMEEHATEPPELHEGEVSEEDLSDLGDLGGF